MPCTREARGVDVLFVCKGVVRYECIFWLCTRTQFLNMLLGFSDEDGSGSEDGLPIDSVPFSVWQAAGQRQSVAIAFHERPANLTGLESAESVGTQSAAPSLAYNSACPVERMLRLALQVNAPQEYVPARPRKKIKGKQPPDLGDMLAVLVEQPDLDPASHFGYLERRAGYHEFERRFGLDVQQPVRVVRARATQLWLAARRNVQNGWGILAQVAKVMYIRVGARTRMLVSPPGDSGTTLSDGLLPQSHIVPCLGALCTWMLALGLNDPSVLQIVGSGTRGLELVTALKSVGLYRQAFDGFDAWVQRKASELGFASRAASMELCMNGSLPHRVHVHCFLGPNVDMQVWDKHGQETNIDLDGMVWSGVRPNIRLLRTRKIRRPVITEAVGGLYYVLTEKPGSMFRSGNRWPFQECMYRSVCLHG